MDMIDTTTDIGKSVLSVSKRFDNIRIGGYIQPQFQIAGTKGTKGFSGGDFAPNVNNRFMLRRGRIRFDYIHFNKDEKPSVQFVFQFDGSERGVFIRDFWGRVFENKYKLFAFTAGMFARPFSYELNLSSSDRESPERGRMSQILMKTERDLGAMLSFEPRIKDHPLKYLKIDVGLFNGPGLSATADYDSHKDFIARIGLKPFPVSKNINLSFAGSYYNGGILQNTKYAYKIVNTPTGKTFMVDSSLTNIGKIAPRKYYGADIQLKIKNRKGFTELRGEYITGTQTSFANTTETPAALPTDNSTPFYIRKFNGAYFYLLQNIFSTKHQLGIKYDWYDPNSEVKENEIGKPGTNINEANIKFSTLSFGYINYVNDNLKLVLWYEKIINEKTQLPGYTSDIKDNIFTCRLQFRF
ncbi:MAG: phosphate-selective porin [Chitinophagaceae bacterium]|nr:phosphate-selective porin [Chitinophagaceae bacterium]